MAVYIVSWDFRLDADYDDKRTEAVAFLDPKGVKVASTTWVVDFVADAEALFEGFRTAVVGGNGSFLKTNKDKHGKAMKDQKPDRVFVSRLNNDQQGWQSESVWDWFKSDDRSW